VNYRDSRGHAVPFHKRGLVVNRMLIPRIKAEQELHDLLTRKNTRRNLAHLGTSEILVNRNNRATAPHALWLSGIMNTRPGRDHLEAPQPRGVDGRRQRLLRQRTMETFCRSDDQKKWMTFVELATAMADYIQNFLQPVSARLIYFTQTSSKLHHREHPRSELSMS